MIFQRISPKLNLEEEVVGMGGKTENQTAEVETVVGSSVQVEGDFASEGNIIVKGTVRGSIYTTKHVTVEAGAKVVATIEVGSAYICGEVRGNIKALDKAEFASSAYVVGDVETSVLAVQAGAVWVGKITMPQIENTTEHRSSEISSKNNSNKNKKI